MSKFQLYIESTMTSVPMIVAAGKKYSENYQDKNDGQWPGLMRIREFIKKNFPNATLAQIARAIDELK
jgi:hypothetical protein